MFSKTAMSQTYLHSTGLAIISLVAATLASTSAAISADDVISAPQGTAVTLGEDGTVTVTDTGSIDVNPGFFAINSNGFNSEITLSGPVSGTINSPGNVDSLATIFQNGDTTNTLIVLQGGNITATDIGAADFVRGVYQNNLTATHTVDLENAQISVTAPNAEVVRGIDQRAGMQDATVQFGSDSGVSVFGGSEGAIGVLQLTQSSNTTSTFGSGTHIDVESTGSSLGVNQSANISGDLTIVFENDGQVDVRSTSLLFLSSTAISQFTPLGSASIILGSGVHITSSGNAVATGVEQRSPENRFVLGEDSSITVASEFFGFGLEQLTDASSGTNSAVLHDNSRISLASENSALGIRQETITGTNTLEFRSNGELSVVGDQTASGAFQLIRNGNNEAEFGSNTRIDVDAGLFMATGIAQNASITGDLAILFGVGTRINVDGVGSSEGLVQRTASGLATMIFGSDTHVNSTSDGASTGILQVSDDSGFVLGELSSINVVAGTDGYGLQQAPSFATNSNSAIIHANSRINVQAGENGWGILSWATIANSSFLTLGHGVEIHVTGDTAYGVDVEASGFDLQNNGGRIFATSTNATPESYGVRMVGDANNFENHGRVFADLAPDSHAILMNGDNNMLSLLTYPVIQGQITFGDGFGTFGSGNTLLIGRGFDAAFTVGADPSQLTVLGQGQSLSVNQIGTNLLKVVSISSEGFFRSSSVRMADDLIRFLQQEITTRGFKNRQFLNQENGLIQDLWFDASGFGQHSTTGRAYSHALGAFTVGYDRAFEDNGLGGVYAGYSIGSVNQGNSYWDNTLQTAYAGIYYDRAFDRILTAINLLGGINWDDVSRTYLDNTVLGGIVNAGDNGVGFLISPEVTVGYEVPYGSHLFVPSVALRYSLFHQDSYSEGGVNGLRLTNRNHQQINVRLQVAGLGFSALNQDATRWSTTLRGGLDIYANWGDDLDATVMGFAVPYDENLNDAGVRPFLGADVEYLVTDRASLDFGVEAAYDSIDAVFGSINAGFSVLF